MPILDVECVATVKTQSSDFQADDEILGSQASDTAVPSAVCCGCQCSESRDTLEDTVQCCLIRGEPV